MGMIVKTEFKVGLFIILTVLLILTGLGFMAYKKGIFQAEETITLSSRTGDGLTVGMPLNISGFKIGKIRDLELNDQGMVIVNQRLKSLVYNFLESARLSSGRRPYTFAVTSVPRLVSDFLDRNEVFLKDMHVQLHVTDDDISVAADAVALDMVFSNLMENSLHYATSSPKVDIRLWKDPKWAFIEFSDTGIGIPKDRYHDIFKMFKRLPDAVSLWSSGTGMGLYVVKGIIKAHGGTIHVKSSTLGKGTSSSIRLPLARP